MENIGYLRVSNRDDLIKQLLEQKLDPWPIIQVYDAWKQNAMKQVLLKEQYHKDQKKLLVELKELQAGCTHPLTARERADSYEPMITWCLICGMELV